MLLILISWCYILFTTLNLGFAFDKIAKLKSTHFIIFIFLGLFFTTILASFWAIFGRINFEFQLFILFINGVLSIKYKSEIAGLYKLFLWQIANVSRSLKWFLLIVFILILAQSASASHIIDNETYYIQTIKWLNEYGFVKGLANLHVFLGQTSGWHIAQSAFNYSFLYRNFNDLNSFCLLFANVFAVLKLDALKKNKATFFIAFLPFANLLFFQFIGAPSPDFAVYILSLFLLFYFVKHFYRITPKAFNLIVVLVLFIIYSKITAFPIIILPIVLLLLNFKTLISEIKISAILTLVILFLFVVKNVILSGYPLFPSLYFKDIITLDYSLPTEIHNFWFNPAKLYDVTVSSYEFHQLDNIAIFTKWLFYSKMDSVFNCIIISLLLITPIFLWRFKNKMSYWILYGTMVLQLVVLFLSSPQYRFILHFVLFFGLLLFSHFIKNKKTIVLLLFVSLIPVAFTIFSPIKSSVIAFENKCFKLENVVFPCGNSNLRATYSHIKIGNLSYFSPDKKTYIWVTGDGDLPCLNTKQFKYLNKKLGYIPQQCSTNLKDGFYSMPSKK